MKITKRNKYTSRANPRRGYHDSVTVLEFEGESEEEREGAKKALVALYQPNNMWCRVQEFTEQRLVINFGYDSGD